MEFLREPEAVFWVFAFPVIMTCALGIAFRSRGQEPVIVGVVEQPGGDDLARQLEQAGEFTVRRLRRRMSTVRFAMGERRSSWCRDHRRPIASMRPGPKARWRGWPSIARYRRRRPSRCLFATPAAGRSGRLPLYRLARARPARHEHHEHRPLGRRLFDRFGADEEAAQAPGGDADVEIALPAVTSAQPPGLSDLGNRRHRRLWLARLRRGRARLAGCRLPRCPCLAPSRLAGLACCWRAGRGRSRRCRD